ncbi:hypothetical protein N9L91_01870, partial [Pseudomonadales bacterium]|nr:hypothetical protein [Pseudomonadales bacterium]
PLLLVMGYSQGVSVQLPILMMGSMVEPAVIGNKKQNIPPPNPATTKDQARELYALCRIIIEKIIVAAAIRIAQAINFVIAKSGDMANSDVNVAQTNQKNNI